MKYPNNLSYDKNEISSGKTKFLTEHPKNPVILGYRRILAFSTNFRAKIRVIPKFQQTKSLFPLHVNTSPHSSLCQSQSLWFVQYRIIFSIYIHEESISHPVIDELIPFRWWMIILSSSHIASATYQLYHQMWMSIILTCIDQRVKSFPHTLQR